MDGRVAYDTARYGPGVAMEVDYDTHGRGYARRRLADPRFGERIEAALGDARTVVNVGAGAGSYEPGDRWVLAVEPSNLRAATALVPIYLDDEKWPRLAQLYEVLLGAVPAGDTDQALDYLEKLRELAASRLGDRAGAFRWAHRAYELRPTDPALEEAVERAAADAGWTLSGSVLGGLMIGYAVGEYYDANPAAVLIGLFTGIVVGFYNLAKILWINK